MLDKIDPTVTISRKDFKAAMAGLEGKLAELQQRVKAAGFPVLILFEGWSAAGKGLLLPKLLNPLDPRYFEVRTFAKVNEEAAMRPFLWRYWRDLPAKGRIGVYDRSWHRTALPQGQKKRGLSARESENFYQDVNAFEKTLIDDGTLIIKLFLHVSREEQKRRFDELRKNPGTAWRVDSADLQQNKQYNANLKKFSQMMKKTGGNGSPWHIIEADDKHYAALKMIRVIIGRIEAHIGNRLAEAPSGSNDNPAATADPAARWLPAVDLTERISKEDYKEKLTFYQNKISELGFLLYARRRSVVFVYEGWDASGKGGNIKRLTQRLDPRGYEVIPIGAPSADELSRCYLWRFMRRMPKDGHLAIFDRSWYGRVMVERVEGLASEAEWRRAYAEINAAERHLYNHGTIIFKFFLHIDKDEQLRRFEERAADPLKRYKITDEDWRNRDKWAAYEKSAEEMLARTSTEYAPWLVVAGNDKRRARITALEYACGVLERELGKA